MNNFPPNQHKITPRLPINIDIPEWVLNDIPKISEITPFLFLTGAAGLHSPNVKTIGITMSVNCTTEITFPSTPEFISINKIRIPVSDVMWSRIDLYFDDVLDKMEQEVKRNGKVLVNCAMGSSRSSTLVMAYLMKKLRIPLRQAYYQTKKQRPCICPNLGFWRQLVNYEKKVFGKNTVKMIYGGGFAPVPDIEIFKY